MCRAHVVRELDHKALRDYKRRALHFFSIRGGRRCSRQSSSGAPGRRATLKETVESYLARRALERDIDRAALVRLGLQYLDDADMRSRAVPLAAGERLTVRLNSLHLVNFRQHADTRIDFDTG